MSTHEPESCDLSSIYWPLRLSYGLVPVIAGFDKFAGILTDWDKYLSPAIASMVPLSATSLLHTAGVIEIAAGILVLAGGARLGGYIVAGWLAVIVVNLVTVGIVDVAVRDLVMAVGALCLAKVAALRFKLKRKPAAAFGVPAILAEAGGCGTRAPASFYQPAVTPNARAC